MAKLWGGTLVLILIAVILLAIFYPDSHEPIVILGSLYLISNLAFLVGRSVYRAWSTSRFSTSIMLSSYAIMALAHIGRMRRQEKHLYPAIIDVLVEHQAINASMARVVLIVSAIGYVTFSLILGLEVNISPILVCALILLAINMNEKILAYRIIHGFYGTNEYEAREILSFIISHGDASDFTTGQGLKDILPIPVPEEARRTDQVLGGEGTQA